MQTSTTKMSEWQRNRKHNLNYLLWPLWEIKVKEGLGNQGFDLDSQTQRCRSSRGISAVELIRPINKQQTADFHPPLNEKPDRYEISSDIVLFHCSVAMSLQLAAILNTLSSVARNAPSFVIAPTQKLPHLFYCNSHRSLYGKPSNVQDTSAVCDLGDSSCLDDAASGIMQVLFLTKCI